MCDVLLSLTVRWLGCLVPQLHKYRLLLLLFHAISSQSVVGRRRGMMTRCQQRRELRDIRVLRYRCDMLRQMIESGSMHLMPHSLQRRPRTVDISDGTLAAARRCTVDLEHQFLQRLLPGRHSSLLCHHSLSLTELKHTLRLSLASLCYVLVLNPCQHYSN